MKKIPGCWEHLSMVWQALKETGAKKSNLAVTWLDTANAFGWTPYLRRERHIWTDTIST